MCFVSAVSSSQAGGRVCVCVSLALAVFYGLCAAVHWPRSHPGATQPVQDSGTTGPCQNPTAPHLLSINASHSCSPSPSHTPPSPSQTYLLILVFPTERHLNYTPAQSLFYIQFKHSVVLPLSLPPCNPSHSYVFLFSLLFQWKKSFAHYVFSGIQLCVVAVNWEPQDIPGPSGLKPPALTPSDCGQNQSHAHLSAVQYTSM